MRFFYVTNPSSCVFRINVIRYAAQQSRRYHERIVFPQNGLYNRFENASFKYSKHVVFPKGISSEHHITHTATSINYAHRRPFCGPVDENRMLTRTLKIKIDLYIPLKRLQSVTKRYRVQMWRPTNRTFLEDKQTRTQRASLKLKHIYTYIIRTYIEIRITSLGLSAAGFQETTTSNWENN